MQYLKHNFAKNYRNYTKAKDFKNRNDMLIDEVAKLIVFDKTGLILAISNSEFRIKRKPSESDLIIFAKKYLPKSNKLRLNIAKVIIINNLDNKEISKYKDKVFKNDTYKVGDKVYGKNKEGQKHSTSHKELGNALKFHIANDVLDEKVKQHKLNKMVMDNKIVSNEDLKKAVKKAKIKSVVYTAGFLVGGYLLFNYIAKKYAVSLVFGNGGAIENNTERDTPIHQPINDNIPPATHTSQGEFDEFGLRRE